jgi:RHS repeat-associated protein
MTQAATPTGRYDLTYDDFGRYNTITTTFLPSNVSAFVRYAYRAWNYQESLVTLGSGSSTMDFGYEYDGTHGPLPVEQFTGGYFWLDFTYDSALRRTGWQETYYEAEGTFTYNSINQMTGATYRDSTSATQYTAAWTYSTGGRITQRTDPDGNHLFTYDDAGRLTGATNPAENYTYDAAGNRRVAGSEAGFVYDAANRLTEDPTFRYEYDVAGNLTRKTNKATSEVTQYTYNAENRLASVVLPGGGTIGYSYDPFGRLLERTEGGSITRLVYDGDNVLAEFNTSGNLVRSYANGPGLDHPEGAKVGGFAGYTNELYFRDSMGTVMARANDHGELTASYRYQSFGKPVTPGSNPRMFAGMFYDSQAGLYYARNRFYDPTTGRFLQRDPILFRGATLPYAYADNDPVNRRDPLGLNPDAEADAASVSGSSRLDSMVMDNVIKPDIFTAGDIAIETGTLALEGALWGEGQVLGRARTFGALITPAVGEGLGTAWGVYAATHEILGIAFSSCPTQAAVDWYSGQWWSPGRRMTNSFLTMGGHMR